MYHKALGFVYTGVLFLAPRRPVVGLVLVLVILVDGNRESPLGLLRVLAEVPLAVGGEDWRGLPPPPPSLLTQGFLREAWRLYTKMEAI